MSITCYVTVRSRDIRCCIDRTCAANVCYMSGIDDAGARERLAAAMEERRGRLRVTWAEIAHRAGMTPQNLYRIRENKISISWDAEGGIERALRWAAGSIVEILSGRPAVELPGDDSAGPPELDTESPAEPPDEYAEESGGVDVIGSDEWILKWAQHKDVLAIGLRVRKKRRELEALRRMLAAREAEIAESAIPHGGSDRS